MAILQSFPLQHFLIIAAMLFCLGIYVILTRKNAVAILMGVELILNATNINLVALSRYVANDISGQVFAVFVIILAAAEAAVALAIIINIYQNFKTVDVDKTDELKG
ncbi:MAG: NADH-quinone oxidoreductase subunit NuoK [Planctomycetes bacterium]|nr:NADH-quinone oxidoreductase subunit NuoK [Planctomycetota bacterium]